MAVRSPRYRTTAFSNCPSVWQDCLLQEQDVPPYVAMKLGGEYARLSTYHYLLEESDNTWCFFLSPEVGCTIFPSEELHLGVHLALYYSYATNSGGVLTYREEGR